MIIAYIGRKYRAILAYCHWYKRLRNRKQTAFVIGTPTHVNIGDSAIALAEIQFLKQNGYGDVIEITLQEYISYRKCIRRLIPRSADVFLPGGGNMGSLWPIEETWRQNILEDFRKHRIVVFPQTIYYEKNSNARDLMLKSIRIYNNIPRLTLIARETISYNLMKKMYPQCSVLLTPDIVLSVEHKIFHQRRNGILTCFRQDKERKICLEDEKCLIKDLKDQGYVVSETDMMSDVQIMVNNQKKIVDHKLLQFAGAKLVITDRLHGMVFCAITGTPCIVLGNNHHKIAGTYEWIKHLDYIKYIVDITEAVEEVKKLYQKGSCVFYLKKDVFSDLEKLVYAMSKGEEF